ncbi:FAD-binding domain-containing protein [Coniochaeta ligniaria NRRL 30616]|uniref:FAD-binding domain-containing protein n=1 Tax=Coniochaeta ligniaria NRRL 30616 TaxID=1408157 RepID=A0A1J7IWI2_9PEZI|nr:FAD-binding domain-containing protein [Coniochaeta ligniaria NRRL 30616]
MSLPVLATAFCLAVEGVSLAGMLTKPASICNIIQDSISTESAVLYPDSTYEFGNDTHHWMSSSSQTPTCVLEAGSPEDLSVAMKVVGCSRTPFAIMSGGHTSNPEFSSTTGVHISLKRFNQLVFSADNSTVEVGTGWTWADLYTALDPTGYNVVGGRTVGPGVGGFTLGGGYSWKTNQFGLTCDTVKSYNLVLPNGTITRASETGNEDLFFALKGGLNRFGAVTSVEFYTHKQSPRVYGGLLIYSGDAIDAVLNATAAFNSENKDPKAQVITTLEAMANIGTLATVNLFYDGPTEPSSFDVFDGIKSALSTVTNNQSFATFIKSIPGVPVTDLRGAFASFSTSALPQSFLAAVKSEFEALSANMSSHSGSTVSYDIEPFTLYGEHATDSAYPHSKSPLPLNLYFAWTSPADDEYWNTAMKESLARLKKVATAQGIYDPEFAVYPNYASASTTAEELYGANTQRLREIKDQIDPKRIMDLAGGFDI